MSLAISKFIDLAQEEGPLFDAIQWFDNLTPVEQSGAMFALAGCSEVDHLIAAYYGVKVQNNLWFNEVTGLLHGNNKAVTFQSYGYNDGDSVTVQFKNLVIDQ